MNDDVQRSLGRIEGTQVQILDALRNLTAEFVDHKGEDARNFQAVRKLSFEHRDELKKEIEDSAKERETHLRGQDTKLAAMKQDSDRAKGAGWVILGLLGSVATFLGGALLSVFNGWVKIH